MPPILDVAIGTVFVFLLFSLVISALNEYLLSLADQRAKFLRLGLAEIFGKSIANGDLNKRYQKLDAKGESLLSHGLISAFSRSDSGGSSPSYIPAGAFVTALLDVVVDKNAPLTNDTKLLGRANAFLAQLQAARPGAGADMTLVAFEKLLTGFLADYNTLPAAPAPDNPLAQLKERVNNALLRAEAQANLVDAGVANPADAQAVIDTIVDLSVKGELDSLFKKAGANLTTFQLSVTGWFSLKDSRDALEFATTSTICGLSRSAAEHTAAAIKSGIENLKDNPKLKESLLSLFRTVEGDVEKFKVAVEGWFNGVMDRVSGWYKRFAQKWMIALGFILAAILNVDTIDIVSVLSNNPNLAKAVAEQAATYVSSEGKPLPPEELAKKREERLQAVSTAEANLKAIEESNEKDDARLKAAREEVTMARAEADALKTYQTAVAKLTDTGIPIGWTPAVRRKLGFADVDKMAPGGEVTPGAWNISSLKIDVLLFMVAGWLVTAIAASVGAPFWFDLLGRFINVRAAGRSPGEKETTSTPTKPPPASLDTTPGAAPGTT